MFWTNFTPNATVKVRHGNFKNGASIDVDQLALFDYFNVVNALNDGNSVDAKVSYRIRWARNGTPLTIDDGSNFHFDGRKTTAVIGWSAHEKGFHFHATPSQTTTTNFALIGMERNGVFYSGG